MKIPHTPPNPTLPAAISLKDAGALLTVHPETLRRMAVDKEIPSVRIRDRWAIPSQYIEDWVNGHLAAWTQNPDGVWQRTPGYNIKTDAEEPDFRNTDEDPQSSGGHAQDPKPSK